MVGIKSILQKNPHSYHSIMMWPACCLAFFVFLRSSEFTVPLQEAYDKEVHLSPSDLAVDNKAHPHLLRVIIKQSKTNPFHQGVTLFLGRKESSICPVTGILPFLAIRGSKVGPLFVLRYGRMLTRQLFSTFLDNILNELHLISEHNNTHSFCIGAATSIKEAGIDDVYIKMMARWCSDAYQQYIRTPPEKLAQLSKVLAKDT